MEIIKCPNCGGDVLSTSDTCFRCGCKINQKTNLKNNFPSYSDFNETQEKPLKSFSELSEKEQTDFQKEFFLENPGCERAFKVGKFTDWLLKVSKFFMFIPPVLCVIHIFVNLNLLGMVNPPQWVITLIIVYIGIFGVGIILMISSFIVERFAEKKVDRYERKYKAFARDRGFDEEEVSIIFNYAMDRFMQSIK